MSRDWPARSDAGGKLNQATCCWCRAILEGAYVSEVANLLPRVVNESEAALRLPKVYKTAHCATPVVRFHSFNSLLQFAVTIPNLLRHSATHGFTPLICHY